MTNRKAFLLCFLFPIISWALFSGIFLLLANQLGAGLFLLIIGSIIFWLLLSLFIVPIIVGSKYGKQFRKYGFYGGSIGVFSTIFLGYLIRLIRELI